MRLEVYHHLDDVAEVREINEHVNEIANNGPILHLYHNREDPIASYSDRLFRNRYRFSKVEFEELLTLVGHRLAKNENKKGLPIPVPLQVLSCLRLFAKGTFQDCAANVHGFSQPTMCRIVKNVSIALAELRPQYIRFPTTVEEQHREMTGFYEIRQFPKVIACIDCTHIKIANPGGDFAGMYINKKIVQLKCSGT